MRELRTDEREVTAGHEVRIIKGKRVDEVVFPKGCLGIATNLSTNTTMFISFESGPPEEPNPSLPFSPVGDSAIYGLRTGETVKYLGKPFKVYVGALSADEIVNYLSLRGNRSDNAAVATLRIDQRKMKKSVRERRFVPGRRLE